MVGIEKVGQTRPGQSEARSGLSRVLVLAVGVAMAIGVGRWLRPPEGQVEVTRRQRPTTSVGRVPEFVYSRATALQSGLADSAEIGAAHIDPRQAPEFLKERTYHPRAPEEFQGFLVDTSDFQDCRTSSDCVEDLACKSGVCRPCAADAECAAGEKCALDHCLKAEDAGCQGRRDCKDGEMCILKRSSTGALGRGGLRSYCLPPTGGVSQADQVPVKPKLGIAPPRGIDVGYELRHRL